MKHKKILTIVAGCIGLGFSLTACNGGGGGSSSASNPQAPTSNPQFTASVVTESNVQPGTFTPNSCTELGQGSICYISLTWKSIPGAFANESPLISLNTTSQDPAIQFALMKCEAQAIIAPEGSCAIEYSYSPTGAPFTESVVFNFQYITEQKTNTLTASPITISGSL